jgi:putative cell wall-binding protein
VLEPEEKVVSGVKTVAYSTPTAHEGITSELVFVGAGDQPSLYRGKDVKGKIVLTKLDVPGPLYARQTYISSMYGAKAIVAIHNVDLPFRGTVAAPEWWIFRPGFKGFPIVGIPLEQGRHILDLMTKGNVKVNLKIDCETKKTKSQNVFGVIKGEKFPDEEVVVSSHHDSVVGMPGGNDNASADSLLLEVARGISEYVKGHKIKRTIKFVSFGAEESGMLGAWYYADQLMKEPERLKRVVAVINQDIVAGNSLFYCKKDQFSPHTDTTVWLSNFLSRIGGEFGYSIVGSDMSALPVGADHDMLLLIGKPYYPPRFLSPYTINGVSFLTSIPYPEYHTPKETMEHINLDILRLCTNVVSTAVMRLANIDNRLITTAGDSFPEALAGGAFAAKERLSVLLAMKDVLPKGYGDALWRFMQRRKAHYMYYKEPITVLIVGETHTVSEAVDIALGGTPLVRIGGKDGYEVSANVAAYGWPAGSETVIIASGEDSSEATAATQLAGCYEAPVLLTSKDELPIVIKESITKLGAKGAMIVGGITAVSVHVEDELKALNLDVKRVAGADKYETFALCAKSFLEHYTAIGDGVDEAILVGEERFSDPVIAGSLAVFSEAPVLLSGKDELPEVTKKFIIDNQIKKVVIVGETAVVSDGVEKALKSINTDMERVAGADKYDTAVRLFEEMEKPLPQPV